MNVQVSQARSLYRRFLRELPSRSPSLLANPSPIKHHIRDDFESAIAASSNPNRGENFFQRKLEEAEQYVQYLKAQRMYTTLLERYNPGINMDEEEKVRLTARRVGMELPPELQGKR